MNPPYGASLNIEGSGGGNGGNWERGWGQLVRIRAFTNVGGAQIFQILIKQIAFMEDCLFPYRYL